MCECVFVKVVSDWLTLIADLYGTILVGGPLLGQFDDVLVLAVVCFALLSRSIGFQMFGNLNDIPLVWWAQLCSYLRQCNIRSNGIKVKSLLSPLNKFHLFIYAQFTKT